MKLFDNETRTEVNKWLHNKNKDQATHALQEWFKDFPIESSRRIVVNVLSSFWQPLTFFGTIVIYYGQFFFNNTEPSQSQVIVTIFMLPISLLIYGLIKPENELPKIYINQG